MDVAELDWDQRRTVSYGKRHTAYSFNFDAVIVYGSYLLEPDITQNNYTVHGAFISRFTLYLFKCKRQELQKRTHRRVNEVLLFLMSALISDDLC